LRSSLPALHLNSAHHHNHVTKTQLYPQPLKRSGPTFLSPQSTTWSTLCKADALHEANGGHSRYWL